VAINTFNNVSIPVGDRTFGPVDIPDGLTGISIRFSNWPQAARTLAVLFEVSVDGGPFEQFFNMNPFGGGRSVGRDGTADSSAFVGPLPVGANRRGQATTTVVGGTVTTTITITST
jgi:hypothetical protein